MNNLQTIAYSFLGMLLLYQLWVTALIYRADEYDSNQRNLQGAVIWLIPLFGALICHLVLRSSRAPIKPSNTDFVPQTPNGEMSQSEGATH
jgi:hypothetical protein